jgi:membrane protease YdiL (CAAX protease family)
MSTTAPTARAIVAGLAIAFVGVGPWALLASLNARIRPDVPWAAAVTLVYLAALILWLNGGGWPRSTSADRRFRLRLWRPAPGAWSGESRWAVLGLILAIVGLYVMWIVTSPDQLITDFSDYPTPAYRISLVVMGALVSGVVEEAAFRGYLQSRLEEFGPTYAILVTSAVFVLAHVTHGVVAMLLMAPGYFVASLLYGALAWRTGSILPGMALHVTGDFLHTMFVLLGGDLRALTMSG